MWYFVNKAERGGNPCGEKSIKPIVEDNTPKVEETMQAYQTSPTVSLIDKAIADAHLLEEAGKIAAALEKWHSLAECRRGG